MIVSGRLPVGDNNDVYMGMNTWSFNATFTRNHWTLHETNIGDSI